MEGSAIAGVLQAKAALEEASSERALRAAAWEAAAEASRVEREQMAAEAEEKKHATRMQRKLADARHSMHAARASGEASHAEGERAHAERTRVQAALRAATTRAEVAEAALSSAQSKCTLLNPIEKAVKSTGARVSGWAKAQGDSAAEALSKAAKEGSGLLRDASEALDELTQPVLHWAFGKAE